MVDASRLHGSLEVARRRLSTLAETARALSVADAELEPAAQGLARRLAELLGGACRYSGDNQSFLEAIADIAAATIDGIRLPEEVRRESEARRRAEEERAAAQAELERVSRLKDEFLATISHELRTPLNAVVGWIHLLRGSPNDPAIFERAVETIERNALAQTRLISDLLDVSSIVGGRLRMQPGPLDLATTVYEVVESLRATAEAKRIQLDLALDPASGLVRGDRARLSQVVWSLVANALKFTPKRGRVRVALQRSGSDVVLTVEDNGEGIPADFLEHVFDPFRQADGSPSRHQGGLGLGLALTHHLVELHGGSVCVQSAGCGQGALFSVRLPCLDPQENAGLAEVPEALEQLEGVRILVVDDDADVLDILGTALRQNGAIVEGVPNARAALAAVRERLPHAMVADIGMPDEDGYALIRRIRALPAAEGGTLPALALTAYTRGEERVRALLAGYQLYVPKPVDPIEVGVAVARLLRSPEARLEPPRARPVDRSQRAQPPQPPSK